MSEPFSPRGWTTSDHFKTFLSEKDAEGNGPRPGIVKAARIILSRISRGFDTSAIVSPPRTGKSNLIRSVAIEAMEIGLVGAVVCMVPWLFLSEQLNDPVQISRMQRHHRMDEAQILPRALVWDSLSGSIDPRFHQQNPKRHWWTMSMAQAQQDSTRLILQSVATYLKQEERRPLLVFIDECHQTSSGPDGWGKLANELRQAGAHLVLLTGTPERSDNVAPFGFRTKEISREDYEGKRVSKTDDGLIRIDTVTADKVSFELDPDYQMTLQEAWSQDIITKIDTRRFAFHSDGQDVVYSSDYKARRALSVALRDPEVVTGAIKYMLDELRLRRNQSEGRDTAAIVFVGSDRDDDDEKDFECRQVKRLIEAAWHEYFPGKADVKIATMGEDGGIKARNTIKRFVGDDNNVGIGDIIIVKQMGGVGLDAPRIKIALDLSTIRTKANAMQRWLRVATKYGDIKYGMLILPDDPVTQRLYKEIIEEQGGQYSLENMLTIDSKFVEPSEDVDKPEAPIITDFRRNGSEDMCLQRIDATEDLSVDIIFAQKPMLALIMSRSQAADLIRTGHLVAQPVDDRPPAKTAMFDAEREVENRKATINKLSKEVANRSARYMQDTEEWKSAIKQTMMATKSHAGILGKLSLCRDIDRLNKAIEFLEQQLRSHGQV